MKTIPKRILVMQTGFIGDVVLISPLLSSLRAAHPQAELFLLVRPETAKLAESIPEVDRVVIFDKRGADSGPSGLLATAHRLKELHLDMIIAPHRSTRTSLLAFLSKAPVLVGFKKGLGGVFYKPRVALEKREPCRLEQEFSLIRAVHVEPVTTRPVLEPPDSARAYAQEFLEERQLRPNSCIGLCIGANWATKRWPATHFARLALMLKDAGYRSVLFGGPGDVQLEEDVKSEFSSLGGQGLYSCVGNELIQALGLLDACACVVGGDTGLVHMARAVDTPVVMIYGPTDQSLHHHHQKERILVADLPCRPCHRHGKMKCPKKHHRCMKDVRPESVYDAIFELLQTSG